MKDKATQLAAFCLLFGASLLITCDPFQKDVNPSIVLDNVSTEYYTLPNSSTIIDLKPFVSSSFTKATLRIKESTKKGELILLDKLLLKYRPSVDFAAGEDRFIIEFIKGRTILLRINISIYVTDFSNLPCGIASEDLVCVTSESVSILFLENDKICSSSSIETSLYIKPNHGQATVHGDTVIYTPSNGYRGPDQFIYKLISNREDTTTSFGVITIPGPAVVQFKEPNQNSIEGNEVTVLMPFSRPACGDGTITVSWSESAGYCGLDYDYGKAFSTSPASEDNHSITIHVSDGDPNARFTVFPIDNELFTRGSEIRFEITSTGGLIEMGSKSVHTLNIIEDDLPSILDLDMVRDIQIDENDTDGAIIEIPFSKPTVSSGILKIRFYSNNGNYMSFTTIPSISLDQSITFEVGPNETGISFTIIPNSNSSCSQLYYTFSTLLACGSIEPDWQSYGSFRIIDDDSFQGSFSENDGTISEGSSEGKIVVINFSKPMLENASFFIDISSAGDCNQWILTDPPTICYHELDGDSQYLELTVLKHAVSAQFKIFPINDNTKGSKTVSFTAMSNLCLLFAPDNKYTLTILDDD